MAEKILNTRIALKIDTLENWNKSTIGLKKGELAIATIAATAGTGLTEPVTMIKIGEDGVKTFSELEWNLYAKASDVLAACKSEASLKTFVNSVIADAGIASNDAMEALAGKVTTAEGKITTLEGKMTAVEGKASANESAITALQGLVGDKKVATQISEAIAALNLGDTYAAKVHKHEISDVNGLSDSIAAAKKAGDDAAEALGTYKTTNDAAVKVNSDAISAIKDGTTIDSFKDVEEALAKKQDSGSYSEVGHKHEIADVNGLSDAIADAKAAGTTASGAAAQALTDAKAYTDTEMTRLVGDTKVADQISGAITALDLDNKYDAKNSASAAQTAAEAHADELNNAMDARVKSLEAIDHEHTFVESELNKIKDGDVAKWNAAEQNAKDYADAEDAKIEARVDALEAKFTGEDSVADQIADAVAGETELREAADEELQKAIDAIEADYLKEEDKTELQGSIDALEELVGDKKVSEAIAEAVKEEADRAKGIEGGLETRLAAVEGDYLKTADKTELTEAIATAKQEAIATVLGEGTSADFDTLKEVADWILSDTTGAAALQKDVADIKADYLKGSDKTELEGKITAAQNAADKAQGEVDALEEVVATKAAQADLETLAGRVTTAEGKIGTLESEMDEAQADIIALETKVGDKTVSEQITAVTNPLAERVVALEAIDHDHANMAELNKIVDGDKAKWDAAVQTVTAGTGLTATKTGTDVAIDIDESVTFVFNCGSASTVI